MALPAIIHIRDLRRVLNGWTRDRIRRFLAVNGLQLKDGTGVTYTTNVLLRDLMPDAHRAMTESWDAMRESRLPDYSDDFSDLQDDDD
jgi:hypothetical protein